MTAAAEAVRHNDNAVLIFADTVQIAYELLPFIGGKLIACTLQSVKKEYAAFYASLETVVTGYFDGLREDVSWFCKKFDYRYDEEPWGNSKDAVERAIAFLAGENEVRE